MPDRKYSVAEIDRMRKVLWKRVSNSIFTNPNYDPYKLGHSIEDELRTYMLNGTDPDELESSERTQAGA